MDQRYLNTDFITQLAAVNYVNMEKSILSTFDSCIFTHNFTLYI